MPEPMSEELEIKSGEKTYCVFSVSEREFLLPSEAVREVVEIARIFPIPGAPEYVMVLCRFAAGLFRR